MSYHRSFPPLTLCTSSAFPRRCSAYASLASEIGAEGIDLDLSTWVGWRVPGLAMATRHEAGVSVRSIWVQATALERHHATADRLSAALNGRTADPMTLAVVLPAAIAHDADLAGVARASEVTASLAGVTEAVVIVPAATPEGGRAHLNRLHVLRRIAEEWSVGIGFDLGSRTDGGWEAEAAVQIVGQRLSLIRLRSQLMDRSVRCVEIHRRTLRAAADQGFRGSISLVPPTPWWLGWHTPSIRAELVANRDVVAHLFAERQVATNHPNSLRLL